LKFGIVLSSNAIDAADQFGLLPLPLGDAGLDLGQLSLGHFHATNQGGMLLLVASEHVQLESQHRRQLFLGDRETVDEQRRLWAIEQVADESHLVDLSMSLFLALNNRSGHGPWSKGASHSLAGERAERECGNRKYTSARHGKWLGHEFLLQRSRIGRVHVGLHPGKRRRSGFIP
jgi:hypothetical protein